MPFLAQARQFSLRRESSSIVQNFTLPAEPFSPRRDSFAQARIPGLILDPKDGGSRVDPNKPSNANTRQVVLNSLRGVDLPYVIHNSAALSSHILHFLSSQVKLKEAVVDDSDITRGILEFAQRNHIHSIVVGVPSTKNKNALTCVGKLRHLNHNVLHLQIEDPTHYSPAINPTDPSLSVQAPSKATLDTTPPVHSSQAPNVSAPEVPEEFETFTNNVGRESTHYWIVEAIDLERVVKQIKVKVREVNNLPIGQRIILDFDEQGAAYGDAQGLLAGFLGTLASDCKLFPIDYDRWSSGHNGIPSTYFTECFDTIIKPRFCFRTSERISRRYCKLSLGRKWSATKTRDEIIRNVPIGIDKDQWTRFVHYRLRPSTVKQVIPHTGGSKTNSRRRREMMVNGKPPGRGNLYVATHKRKDGTFVNESAKIVAEQIKEALTQANSDESEVSPHDSVGRVMGLVHSGRVLTMGIGAVPTNTYRNSRLRVSGLSHSSSFVAESSSSNDLRERCNNLESAFKSYIIMKEGGIPKELANFFTQANEDASMPDTPLGARGSSGASNWRSKTISNSGDQKHPQIAEVKNLLKLRRSNSGGEKPPQIAEVKNLIKLQRSNSGGQKPPQIAE
ncbi:hypothetical protein Lal_00015262, partial [Lupinus albus]